MATAFALIAGVLLPGWGEFSQFKRVNGAVCSHRSECFSDCCLIDLDQGGTFCAPKARIDMACLPQTKGAINIMCPCRIGLRCKSKDVICPRRCYLL